VDSNTDAERIRFGRTSDALRYSSIYHKLSDSSANNFMTFKMHNGSAQVDALKIEGGGDVTVGVGNLVIGTSGKGVDFGVTTPDGTSVSSEILDDYEEGTWTPVYSGAGGSIGSTAYDSQIGTYTKIGNIVYLSGVVDLSNNGDWVSTSLIQGVPFNAANNNAQNTGGAMLENVTIATTNWFSRVGPNEQYVTFTRNVNDAGSVYLQTGDVADTAILRFSLVYTAA
jgi:hypothetical protein